MKPECEKKKSHYHYIKPVKWNFAAIIISKRHTRGKRISWESIITIKNHGKVLPIKTHYNAR